MPVNRPTVRADRVTVAAPANLAEQLEGLLVAQGEDLPYREAAGGRG
jgi:hypothetical protein